MRFLTCCTIVPGGASMSKLIEGLEKGALRVLHWFAPGLTEKLKVNAAVGAEKSHRPHPFSLWTGMTMGRPPEGYTAPTAKPLAAHALSEQALGAGAPP